MGAGPLDAILLGSFAQLMAPTNATWQTDPLAEGGLVRSAWEQLGDPRRIEAVREVSAAVSTNRVYELTLSGGEQLIAKASSYGSYVHFRQDHQLIHHWCQALRGRLGRVLARIVLKDGRAFTHRQGDAWLAFYHKIGFYDFLPRVLSPGQVRALGSEMAHLHRASASARASMDPSWKSVGADVGTLHGVAGSRAWREARGFPDSAEGLIRRHCETFLEQAEALGYHSMPKIPVLIDWNTGNFSVGLDGEGFSLYSRWDYDWFRLEPRIFDFYFCARVVRAEGDQTLFSYTGAPLLEARFLEFLHAYQRVHPLERREVLMLKEAYRFFVLHYVVHSGEHFFRPSYRKRLLKEALEQYLPALETLDLRPVADAVAS